MYRAKELRDQSLGELEAIYKESQRELFKLNGEFRSKKQREAPHQRKHVRKDIARLLTVMTEKRRQEG